MHNATKVSPETVARVEAAVAALQAKYPQLGITFGYIGNVGMIGRTFVDDRSWRLFTNVRVMAHDPNPAQVFLEGFDFDAEKADKQLERIVARIRCVQAGYELIAVRRRVTQIMDGKATYGYALRRLTSTEAHGDFDTATEAADAAEAAKRADQSVGVGQ